MIFDENTPTRVRIDGKDLLYLDNLAYICSVREALEETAAQGSANQAMCSEVWQIIMEVIIHDVNYKVREAS